jgi:tetratricopeptide (TPR) repeat protein
VSEEIIERAELLDDVGRKDEAIALLLPLLASEPENVDALVALTSVYLDTDLKAALETAQRAMALDPDDVRPILHAAGAALDLNRVPEGVMYARRAVEEAPWLAAAHALLAFGLCRRKKTRGEARQAAQRAIELEPNLAVGYNAAGTVELAAGEWKAAADWYRKALEVEPHDTTAQANLVTAQEADGRLAPAFADAHALLTVDPRDEHGLEVLKETVYTTLVHMLWIAAVVFFAIAALRGVI